MIYFELIFVYGLPTKFYIVKAVIFLVVMYRYESWTIKRAEHRRTDAFKLWCWRKLWRVPWTAWRSNQPILKEINSLSIHCKDWSWSWSCNTWTAWCKQMTHWKRLWCWERLRAGEGATEDEWLDSITDSMDMSLSKLQEIVKDRES